MIPPGLPRRSCRRSSAQNGICGSWILPPLAERDESPGKGRVLFEEANRHAVCSDDLTLTALPGPPVCFQLEFDREVAAHIGFEVESGGEPPGSGISGSARQNPCNGEIYDGSRNSPFRSTRLNAFRYIQLRVACGSFRRSTMLRCGSGTSRRIRGDSRSGRTAPFECSDPELMKIRECVDRTMRLCMMRLHLDSPVHQKDWDAPAITGLNR